MKDCNRLFSFQPQHMALRKEEHHIIKEKLQLEIRVLKVKEEVLQKKSRLMDAKLERLKASGEAAHAQATRAPGSTLQSIPPSQAAAASCHDPRFMMPDPRLLMSDPRAARTPTPSHQYPGYASSDYNHTQQMQTPQVTDHYYHG